MPVDEALRSVDHLRCERDCDAGKAIGEVFGAIAHERPGLLAHGDGRVVGSRKESTFTRRTSNSLTKRSRSRRARPNWQRRACAARSRTMMLRDYGKPGRAMPTLVDAPHAGHTAMIADYHKGQSLIETLLANGIGHVALTDWKSATSDMKDFEIDNYLAEIVVAIDDLGGRVNLVGLCQGGWVSAMVAARFPGQGECARACGRADRHRCRQRAHQAHGSRVADVVLRGARGHGRRADAGQVHVAGLEEHASRSSIIFRIISISTSISTIRSTRKGGNVRQLVRKPNRPARPVVSSGHPQLFKENRLAEGEFVGLGRKLNLRESLARPISLAGAADDITTPGAGARRRQLSGHA